MKCVCSLRGLFQDRMAKPFEAFHKTEREKI
jgi:hypothetical protein